VPELAADAALVRRIVVVRPNHRLGNNVLLTPLLAALETRYPQATVDIVTGGHAAAEIFKGYRNVAAVLSFPGKSARHPAQTLGLLWRLLTSRYDLAVDPVTRSRGGRALLWLVSARQRVGFAWGRWWRDRTLTHAVRSDSVSPHLAQCAVQLVQDANAPMPALDLRLDATERARGVAEVRKLLPAPSPGRLLVGIYATATAAKNYSTEWWQTAIAELQQRMPNIDIVEFAPHDGVSRLQNRHPLLICDRPRDMCAVLSAVPVIVSGDCGVMHLAVAAGSQVIGLFKATDPVKYAPYGNGSTALMTQGDEAVAVAGRICELLEKRAAT
jgi:heptosyltransferase-3